jgi:GDP-D-mannose 3', 5'-epimerase
MRGRTVLVTGAGGFIGHHLVSYLVRQGCEVRAVDLTPAQYEPTAAHEFLALDLRYRDNCRAAVDGMSEVYHLAADMGGIGYISGSHAVITLNNALINAHMIEAARQSKVEKLLFSSSACIYPQHLQKSAEVAPLREDDAWPAEPEEGYGLEKLFMEKLCEYAMEDWAIATRVVRFHNVYGPLGTYDGGREKAPAAICRKIASCHDGDAIEIWGDGQQTRSFMYIDDCVEGIYRIMQSDYSAPLNLGTDELVSVDQLVDIVATTAGKSIVKRHDRSRPQGVRGRNSDNTRLRQVLGWEPRISLRQGIRPTYEWIEKRVSLGERLAASVIAAE